MIEFLIHWNTVLMSAPAGVVVAIYAIVLGYVLKSAEFFPNKRIPVVVVLFTSGWFPIVQFCADQVAGVPKAGWRIPLNLMLGFVLGGIAWFFHAQILKRWVDPALFKADALRPNSNPSANPSAATPTTHENKT